MDMDLANFELDREKLDFRLKGILKKIEEYHGFPTVLWTGNGYHIYLPTSAIVLDEEEIFSKDKFTNLFSRYNGKYEGYSVSELFLLFAEEYLTSGKADPQHRVKYKSCLIRIPNTFNSKCLAKGFNHDESKVRVIQKWNSYRPPIQLTTKNFIRWLVQEEIDERSTGKKNRRRIKSVSAYQGNKSNNIEWIETLLKTPISDHRKYCLWRILTPYLINVKRIDKDNAYRCMEEWLNNCDELQKLQFNPKIKIKERVKYVKNYLPISKKKLKDENPELYIPLIPFRQIPVVV